MRIFSLFFKEQHLEKLTLITMNPLRKNPIGNPIRIPIAFCIRY